jgi:estrogen-related receptor beta like 1
MAEIDENSGPGAAYEVFVQNENLMEKLKILDYEKEFISKQRGLRVISKITFSIQNKENQGEQFTQFMKLGQYLLKSNGVSLEGKNFKN